MSITNVARSGAGLMRLSLGQRLGAAAAKPGAFSYDQRIVLQAEHLTGHFGYCS